MSSAGPSLAEIKQLLQSNVEALARQLAPDGRRSGAWWLAKNPTRKDDNPSLGIGLGRDAPGAWKDFSGDAKGDILDLIAYVNGFPPLKSDVKPTLDWARAFLGLSGAAPPAVAKRVTQARAEAEDRARSEIEQAAKNIKRAKAAYLASKKRPFRGSPAERYLNRRGIDFDVLGRVPGSLGWLPDVKHLESGKTLPAMVAGFTGDDNQIVAIHRTFLQADGAGKAQVSPARKIWPSFQGAAIRLWRGASGLSVDQAIKHGLLEQLILVEGVEDGLTAAMAFPECRVWAAGSLANLGNLKIPACCDEVIVCADNDWGKPAAEKLLKRAIAAIAAQGKGVRVARSRVGKDMNDALMDGV